jgi:hypothetical protein
MIVLRTKFLSRTRRWTSRWLMLFAWHLKKRDPLLQIVREVQLVANSDPLWLFLGSFNSEVSDPGYNCTAIKRNE